MTSSYSKLTITSLSFNRAIGQNALHNLKFSVLLSTTYLTHGVFSNRHFSFFAVDNFYLSITNSCRQFNISCPWRSSLFVDNFVVSLFQSPGTSPGSSLGSNPGSSRGLSLGSSPGSSPGFDLSLTPSLQVKLGRLHSIRGVATQGRHDADQWVKSFSLAYTADDFNWVFIRENSQVKVS